MNTVITKTCLLSLLLAPWAVFAGNTPAAATPTAIPWSDIGARVGTEHQGEGLSVSPGGAGARLHCAFQRLDGEATPNGLWLTSTAAHVVNDRFCVTATEVVRRPVAVGAALEGLEFGLPIASAGSVTVAGRTVRFSRPGLTEEYSVSLDGVRQDFIIEQEPLLSPAGELVVNLAVTGAAVEPAADGARLVLEQSGRVLAYSRLQVTDATGRKLPARMEVHPTRTAAAKLAIAVDDTGAVYPVRIDPTFSDANWISMGGIPGTDGAVFAVVTDGAGNLYIGGQFTAAGTAVANNVAEWTGTNWRALGSGTDTEVVSLAYMGGNLYAGGLIRKAGGVAVNSFAVWNGSSWSAVGQGVLGFVNAMAVSGGTLYVGGDFKTAGGITATNIVQFNGGVWSPLGTGVNNDVEALAVSGSSLYAGGYFTNAGGNAANFVAQWNGSGWSALGSGMNSTVYALTTSGSTLYAGGNFTTAGSVTARNIAQWNGSAWSAVGSGTDNTVQALAVSGGILYAAGNFLNAGGNPAQYIAQWDGSNWSPLGSGINAPVAALLVSAGTLFAVGGPQNVSQPNPGFSVAGGVTAENIAQWNGSSWSALGGGMNGPVLALAASGSALYVGGSFTSTSGAGTNYIAEWDGTSWSALGTGMNGPVRALAIAGSNLYAGGSFMTAGGNLAANIACWNGSAWSALGSGINGPVFALATSDANLYAAGAFLQAGATTASNIAQWNGTSWSPVGMGLNSTAYALAVSGSNLYVGGAFSAAGGTTVNGIAQWDGANWSALGSGILDTVFVSTSAGSVYGLAASGGTLYAVGKFSTAGGVSANNVAQWNGSAWASMGSLSTPYYYEALALAVCGGTVYAGGEFVLGPTFINIAQWDGSAWVPLGSGLVGAASTGFDASQEYGSVNSLLAIGDTLYAGGNFITAGTNVSYSIAQARLSTPPLSVSVISSNQNFGFAAGSFGFDIYGPASSNVVVLASPDLHTWTPVQTNSLGIGICHFTDPQSATNTPRYYRAELLLQ